MSNPSIEARGLKPYLESLGLSYEEFEAIMKDEYNKAKVAYAARWANVSYPTALKWVVVYKKENKQDNKSEKENNNIND